MPYSGMTTQTMLRIPRGLWDDLEESVIKQDRQFLIEVAKSLGLPVQEVLRKCLGTRPTQTSIPVLWSLAPVDQCPWYTLRGSLWHPCTRKRLSPTVPCCVHEKPGPFRLSTDPIIQEATEVYPVIRNKITYWVDPDSGQALHEDGHPEISGTFRFSQFRGNKIAIWTGT